MKRSILNPRSLFVRVFLTLWLAAALVAVLFVVIHEATVPRQVREYFGNLNREVLSAFGTRAAIRLRHDDLGAAQAEFQRLHSEMGIESWLMDEDGRGLLDGPVPPLVQAIARGTKETGEAVEEIREGSRYLAVPFELRRSGERFVVLGRFPHATPWERFFSSRTLTLRLLAIILVAGLLAFPLARYLSRPVRLLRGATRRVAEGDLSVRVVPALGSRRDEVGMLAEDFDQMTERIDELMKRQSSLLRDVSHELRSPLARLNVALELARRAIPESSSDAPDTNPAVVAAQLRRIERESERLQELITEILTVTRLEAQLEMEMAPVSVVPLLEEIVSDADFEAQGTHRSVVLEVDEASRQAGLTCRGDRELLRRAIENVVRNAARYTPEESEVKVTLSTSQETFTITVRDFGPGVPDTALSAMFSPFYRVDSARDRADGGAGLGLAIAERAVIAHDGEIQARNIADEEGGLEVMIRLPRAAAELS